MKAKKYLLFLLIAVSLSGSVLRVRANEPYIPAFPMIIGEQEHSGASQNSGPTFEGDTPGNVLSKEESTIIPKILTSNEIGKGVNTGYGVFEKLRLEGLRRLESQKQSLLVNQKNVDVPISPGENAERGHDALLVFILSVGIFILAHPLIAYIVLVLLTLAVLRTFL